MKNTLEEVWNELKAGDIIAYQGRHGWDGTRYTVKDKVKMATVVAVDVWDMACVVGVVDLCKFDCYGISNPKEKLPEIEWLVEWSASHYVLGLWHSVPSLSEVKKAFREFRLSEGGHQATVDGMRTEELVGGLPQE